MANALGPASTSWPIVPYVNSSWTLTDSEGCAASVQPGKFKVFGKMGDLMLKRGDVVEVRSPDEILATLDDNACRDAMPFMPEMIKYSCKRFTVSHRAEKICDTVREGGPPRSRRMRDTVLLDDLRCDGSGHDGCQAGCRIYWNESWLRRVDPNSEPRAESDGLTELAALTSKSTRAGADGSNSIYRCQATEASRASELIGKYDLRHHIRELTTGNVKLSLFLRVAVRALGGHIGRRLRIIGYVPMRSPLASRLGRRSEPVKMRPPLNLQPGEWVEIRSPNEIEPTLNDKGKTRGLSFDQEMKPYCGGRYRVQDRVEQIIDERSGKMIHITSDCLILDGVVCSGHHSMRRWFCPRAIYPYWREAWLRRVEGPSAMLPGGSEADAPNYGSG